MYKFHSLEVSNACAKRITMKPSMGTSNMGNVNNVKMAEQNNSRKNKTATKLNVMLTYNITLASDVKEEVSK